jgi:GT2 family glycosyltransferase
VLSEDWTRTLVEFLGNHPEAGSCQSKVLFSTNGLINTLGISPLPDGGARDLGIGLPDRPLGNIEIFGVSGAASLYRRSALDMVGLFDEDFFAYLEDVDLAWRLKYAGWRSYLVGSVVVYHAHSKSAKGRQFKTHMAIRNANYVLIKDLPTRNMLLFPLNYLRTRLGSSVAKQIRYDHFTKPLSPITFVSTIIGANAEALSKLPSMFNKRNNIRKTMKVSRVQALEWFRRYTSDLNHYVQIGSN